MTLTVVFYPRRRHIRFGLILPLVSYYSSTYLPGNLRTHVRTQLLAQELNTTPELVWQALEQAQQTLCPDPEMTNLILKLGAARMWPGGRRVKVFGLSNITKVARPLDY